MDPGEAKHPVIVPMASGGFWRGLEGFFGKPRAGKDSAWTPNAAKKLLAKKLLAKKLLSKKLLAKKLLMEPEVGLVLPCLAWPFWLFSACHDQRLG